MTYRLFIFCLLLCASTSWLAVAAQTEAPGSLAQLLDAAKSWPRQVIREMDPALGRVVTIGYPTNFTVLDEDSRVMPFVVYSALKSSTDNSSQTPALQSMSVENFKSLIGKLDDALLRLAQLTERTYVQSSDNVVARVGNYTMKVLFDVSKFNNTLYATMDQAVSDCSRRAVNYADCRVANFGNLEVPIAIFNVLMVANRIGRSNITFMLSKDNDVASLQADDTYMASVAMIVIRPDRLADIIFRWVMTVFIVVITFGMGCDLDLKVIWVILKKPFAPLIGLCSQFVLMPLISFGIGQLFLNTPDTKLFGFGLLVVGCSPGGGSSNMWTLMLGGHLDLSMTMTFFSSSFALGMMPLWLFILGSFYVDPTQVLIPYVEIIKNLTVFTIPAALGIVLRTCKQEWAEKAQGPVKYAALLYLVFMITFGSWVNWWMYRTISYFPFLIPIAMILPWCGMVFGYTLAFILRQGHRRALTIGIETGIQNVGIAMIILRFAFPPPDGQLASVVVMIVVLFTPIPLYLALIGRGIYIFCKKRSEEKSNKRNSASEGLKLRNLDNDELA